MQKVLEVLNKAVDFLEKKGIEKPRLDAEWLLAEGLGCKRLDLYLKFEDILSEGALSQLRELVRRRGNHEPLQYILGEVPFMDITLKVDGRALIPRPETEELAERLLEIFAGFKPKKILDLGTGTGALALALAYRCKDAQVLGVDINPESIELAKENAKLNALDKRVSFIESDWFSNVEGSFDCIVSNPPYLTEEEYNSAQPEVKEFEPRLALVSEEEGVHDLKNILSEAKQHLTSGGIVALETGIKHHEALASFARELGYTKTLSEKDLQGRDRFFFVFI